VVWKELSEAAKWPLKAKAAVAWMSEAAKCLLEVAEAVDDSVDKKDDGRR
jgi:hypothetical protein